MSKLSCLLSPAKIPVTIAKLKFFQLNLLICPATRHVTYKEI